MRERETYTVFGYWADTNERYGERYDADDAHDAEVQALRQARQDDGDLRIAGTMVGEQDAVDLYTAFIDPDDERNEQRGDLEVATDELEVVEWTVLGIALSPDRRAWNEQTGGERMIIHEMAYSPRIAEDLARERVRVDSGLELVVCTVLAGRRFRCESYPFSDHSVKAA